MVSAINAANRRCRPRSPLRCNIQLRAAVSTRVAAGADDRFFPLEFQRRIVAERLGLDVDVLPGGHLIALSHPAALTAYLLAD